MTIIEARPATAPRDGHSHPTTAKTDLNELVVRRIQDHIDRNFPGETISILGTFGDILEAFDDEQIDEQIDEQEMRDHMAALIQHGRWPQVWDRVRQVNSGAAPQGHPRAGDCPPWCAPDAHALSIDTCHAGEIFDVELSHHPYEENQTHHAAMHAALRQEAEAAEPSIYLSGQDEATDNVMTLTEAAAVRDMLARLVATGHAAQRAEQRTPATPECPAWCVEDHRPIELDDGLHGGPLLSVREVDRDKVREGRLVLDLLLSLRRQPDLKGTRVTVSALDSAEEYLLTPGEAEELAGKLLELAATARIEPDRTA